LSNVSLGLIFIISVCISLPVFFQSIRRRREQDASLFYILACASSGLWTLLYACFFLVPDTQSAVILHGLRLVFVSYSALFFFLFALKSLRHIMPGKTMLAFLGAFPLITLILVLTNQSHGLVRTAITIIVTDGVRIANVTNGLWFWIHCVYSYTLLALAAVLMIQQCTRLPSNYRLSVILMLCSLFLTMAVTVISMLGLFPFSIDAAPIALQISQIVFYYALFHTHSLDILFTSRDALFENASDAIFILEPGGHIVDYNQQATSMGHDVGISNLYNQPYQDMLDKWMTVYNGRFFQEDASIFTIHRDGADMNYQITSADIFNQHHKAIGSYMEIKNITPMMSLIHQLQDFAYYDQLTGLRNRHSLVYEINKLDCVEALPLGIMVGDVNRLKQVNDTHGHAAGDLLLQSITNILVQASPSKTLWFRSGGDEFIALNPRTSEQEMERLSEEIRARCSAFTDPRFLGAGIALAYRIKAESCQDLHALMQEADRAMYTDKNDRRASACAVGKKDA